MLKSYEYVGPREIRARARSAPPGALIETVAELLVWLKSTDQSKNSEVIATFVIDLHGRLRIADRHSEHVACANGEAVQSAGEITFLRQGGRIEVVDVSNQSVGFCPEPESWPEVASALERIGLVHPGGFTRPIVFRRCESCGQINIVKDDWFICLTCGKDLPKEWNLGES